MIKLIKRESSVGTQELRCNDPANLVPSSAAFTVTCFSLYSWVASSEHVPTVADSQNTQAFETGRTLARQTWHTRGQGAYHSCYAMRSGGAFVDVFASEMRAEQLMLTS